jgi:hypothetical protein
MLAYEQSPQNPSLPCKDEIYMEYYKRTGESGKYAKYATNFCNNKLMRIFVVMSNFIDFVIKR